MRPAALAGLLLLPLSAGAIELRSPEGDLFAFPSLLDDRGNPQATSTYEQWWRAGKLHVRTRHEFADGRSAVERARFSGGRELVQEAWSFVERRGDEVLRAFDADLVSGRVRARKREGDEEKRWDRRVKVERGRTFAGLGVPYAVKNLRDRLVAGARATLRVVGFFSGPRSARVRVKHAGREAIEIGGRRVDADRFEVRVDLKGLERIVDLARNPAGADVWLHHGMAPMILRVRYRLLEPGEPVVVLETLGAPRRAPAARSARPPPKAPRESP